MVIFHSYVSLPEGKPIYNCSLGHNCNPFNRDFIHFREASGNWEKALDVAKTKDGCQPRLPATAKSRTKTMGNPWEMDIFSGLCCGKVNIPSGYLT